MSSQCLTAMVQYDALREVATIGAGHAATALSQLTGRRVMVSVPRVRIAERDVPDLVGARHEGTVTAAVLDVEGNVQGQLLFLMPSTEARTFCAFLLGRASSSGGPLDALERSSLTEAANVLCGAWANALAAIIRLPVMLSVPILHVDVSPRELVVRSVPLDGASDFAICVETALRFDDAGTASGYLLLLPSLAALRTILDQLWLNVPPLSVAPLAHTDSPVDRTSSRRPPL